MTKLTERVKKAILVTDCSDAAMWALDRNVKTFSDLQMVGKELGLENVDKLAVITLKHLIIVTIKFGSRANDN